MLAEPRVYASPVEDVAAGERADDGAGLHPLAAHHAADEQRLTQGPGAAELPHPQPPPPRRRPHPQHPPPRTQQVAGDDPGDPHDAALTRSSSAQRSPRSPPSLALLCLSWKRIRALLPEGGGGAVAFACEN